MINPPIWVVIPSRTDEYIDPLLKSLYRLEPIVGTCIAVADNGLSEGLRNTYSDVRFAPTARPFVFAQAINVGIKTALGQSDPVSGILVLNDDTEMLTDHWLTKLRLLLEHPEAKEFGMISLMIKGGVGNEEQEYKSLPSCGILETKRTICFVANLIRTEALHQIGLLDERFSGYGWDDDDYCRRLRNAGWRLGITNAAVVQHGKAGLPHSSSYVRYHGPETWRRMGEMNKSIYLSKWGESKTPVRYCLNLGCGEKGFKSNPDGDAWVNLDVKPFGGVDVVHDIRQCPWPFPDQTFDHVLADNILEHMAPGEEFVGVINELNRVLKVGGTAMIIVPHCHSQGAVQDPTHKMLFVPRSVMYWNQEMTPYGGLFIGITANLVPDTVDTYGDPQTEYFIKFNVRRKPWPPDQPVTLPFVATPIIVQ